MGLEDALKQTPAPVEPDVNADAVAAEEAARMAQMQREDAKNERVDNLRKKLDDQFLEAFEEDLGFESAPETQPTEKVSGTKPQSGGSEGKTETTGDTLPDDLVYRAKLAGLPEAAIKAFHGANAQLLETTVAELLRAQALSKPVVVDANREVVQPPVQPKTEAEKPPVPKHSSIQLPPEADEWEPSLKKWAADMVQHYESRLEQNQQTVQQVMESQQRQWLAQQNASDKKYGEYLKDPAVADQVFLAMHALQGAARRNNLQPMTAEKLRERAVAAVLSDKIVEVERKQLQEGMNRQRRRASLPPVSKGTEGDFGEGRKTVNEIKRKLDADWGERFANL